MFIDEINNPMVFPILMVTKKERNEIRKLVQISEMKTGCLSIA